MFDVNLVVCDPHPYPYSPKCVEGAHDELADFLCKVQGEVVEEAGRLLGQRTAE